jgi:hypothetical protein
MAAAESAAKICVVCGVDVAGKPRVKDGAGHYMCVGACQEKAVAAAKARAGGGGGAAPARPVQVPAGKPPAKTSQDGSLMNDLISASPMLNAARCTECGNPMPTGAVLCTRCGFNSQTGKALKTAVIKEKEVKEAAPKGKSYQNRYASSEFGPSFGVLFLIFAGGISALAVLGFAHPMFTAAAFGLGWLLLGVGGIWGIVSAFLAGEIGWGVAMFIVPFAAPIYMLFVTEDKWSKSIYVGALVGLIVAAVMLFGVLGQESLNV